MTRSSFLWVFPGAALALAACDIPSATFDGTTSGGGDTISAGPSGSGGTTSASGGGDTVTHPTSTTGGAGGVGGSSGSGGTATTTTTTTTTTGGGAVVPCNYPVLSDCNPGQVCCYDKTTGSPVDKCAAPGGCNPASMYGELQCNDHGDCPGQVCCLYALLDIVEQKYNLQKSYCADTCAGTDEHLACDSTADCGGAQVCVPLDNFYTDYQFCVP